MVKLVRESLDFERTGNVKSSLGIGREAFIRKFFRDLYIPDENYIVRPNGKIIFNTGLYLGHSKITELPNNLTIMKNLDLTYSDISKIGDNLKVYGNLYLSFVDLDEFPNNLIVRGSLILSGTDSITELPDDLIVDEKITVLSRQIKLIEFIKNSKYKNKLNVWP